MRPKRTIPRVCEACGDSFLALTAEVRRGKAVTCSRACGYARRRAHRAVLLTHEDGSVSIPLHARDGSIRAYALVDAADAPWIGQWRWSLNSNGYAWRNHYLGGGRDAQQRHSVLLHREILGLKRGSAFVGDHINRDRLDNRRSNLRAIPRTGNPQNVPPRQVCSSCYRGVWWNPATQSWRAGVTIDGKMHYLGCFADEDEAGRVARSARARLLPYAVD